MTSFIVHARGFVLDAIAQLLRERGAPVLEAPDPEQAARYLAEAPTAVLVCNGLPALGSWARRRVILLDGISDGDVVRLVDGGARVRRLEGGGLDAFLDAALTIEASTPEAEVVPLAARRSERPLLTPRQLEVVDLIAHGLTSQEIADELSVRPKTVENYKQRLFARLGVQNQAHAVARCAHLGLIGERPVATLAS